MELKHIKELMAAMGRTGTKRLSIKKEGFELELEREDYASFRGLDTSTESSDGWALKPEHAFNRVNMALSKGGELPSPASSQDALQKEDTTSTFITSPMVGTFYAAPSPEDASFVKVGDKVDKNSIVCIIEAMKVMNEVKANENGTIVEVLVESGNPVEFGTKLFRITPN